MSREILRVIELKAWTRYGLPPSRPILWGEVPPGRDIGCWLGRPIMELTPQQSLGTWIDFLAEPNPCAIGQPCRVESTESWESRITINGRRAR